jgi:hypothetical protein
MDGQTDKWSDKYLLNIQGQALTPWWEFESDNDDDLKKKISQNVSKTFKSNSVDVHITGPFRNNNSWWRRQLQWWWLYQQNIPFWNNCLILHT